MGISETKLPIILATLFLSLTLASKLESGVAVIGGLTHERVAEAGEGYDGIIIIKNPSQTPVEVKLYQTDYQFFHDGTNVYGEPGKLRRSNAKWISLTPHRLVIPPQATSAVNYSVQVPDSSHLSGTFWSIIMVEEISGDSPEATHSNGKQVQLGIKQVWRLGIQMVTHVGYGGACALKFLNAELLRINARTILQVDIENVGERWLRALLWAELYDLEGICIGRFEGDRLRTFPGTSARYKIDLSDIVSGTYKALVAADGGGDDVFGVNYDLSFHE